MRTASLPNRLFDRIGVLVCFSHLRWGFVYQRPQHVLSRAAASYLIYFLEEPVFERGGVPPRLDLHPQADGVVVAVPILAEGMSDSDAAEAQKLLLDELLRGHGGEQLIFWYYTPMALEFSAHCEPDLIIYDCMDELSAFRGASRELTAFERKLFERAHLVFTGGRSLYEAKRGKHQNVHCLPSSIDKAHFARARRGLDEPADQARLPHPRIGFFGVIDERMDIDLLAQVAALRPQWQFVMLGPVVKIDPGDLPLRSNIHWLGSKSYTELLAYLAGWDAGFMPFALNESTRFISPTKTPEFLAAGVPVVSTPIADIVRPYGEMELVEIAADARTVIAKLGRLLAWPKADWLERVDRHLDGMSWDGTWTVMDGLMRQVCKREAEPVGAFEEADTSTS